MPLVRRAPAEHVADDEQSPLWAEHVARYRAAAERPGRRVLDIACGSGLGLEVLASTDREVVAGDLNPDALREASRAHGGASLCRLDVTRLPFRDDGFDLVTCFETIEHVRDDGALVAELRRVVSPEGAVLVSTPRRPPGAGPVPTNPFHIREYDPAELATVLGISFARVELLGQVPSGTHRANAFWSTSADPWTRARRIVLKLSLRLPRRARAALDRHLPRTLFPGPADFEFVADRVDDAPVLVAVCRV